MTDAQVVAELTKWAPLYDKIEESFNLPFQSASPYGVLNAAPNSEEARLHDYIAESNASAMMFRRLNAAQRLNDTNLELLACEQLLRYSGLRYEICSLDDFWLELSAAGAVGRLRNLRASLKLPSKRKALDALQRFDRQRPSFEALEQRQRILDQNSGWMSHLALALDDWSGIDHYQSERYDYFWDQTILRLVIAEYALDLFQEQQGVYPDALAELVPDILPYEPIDPFSDKPLVYRRDQDGYLLYSIGHDQRDDGSRPMADRWASDGDITTAVALDQE